MTNILVIPMNGEATKWLIFNTDHDAEQECMTGNDALYYAEVPCAMCLINRPVYCVELFAVVACTYKSHLKLDDGFTCQYAAMSKNSLPRILLY